MTNTCGCGKIQSVGNTTTLSGFGTWSLNDEWKTEPTLVDGVEAAQMVVRIYIHRLLSFGHEFRP